MQYFVFINFSNFWEYMRMENQAFKNENNEKKYIQKTWETTNF